LRNGYVRRIAVDLRVKRDKIRDPTQLKIFDNSFRIAVLHHHVSPFAPSEVKEFEDLVDASFLKSTLLEQGFHMILHGHKHQPRVTRESVIDKKGERSIVIVAAGSLGDWQSGSSFNIITVCDPLQKRVKVQVDVMRMTADKAKFESEKPLSFVIRKDGKG
jgi:predicted phosphodiesterase